MRKLVFNLHLSVALIASLFVVILGVTGSIMAFEQEIADFFHADLIYVKPGLHRLSLTEISGALPKTLPCERAVGYGIPTAPDRSYQIVSHCGMVFVNPYTGEVLGTQIGPDAVSAFLGSVHQLHLRLLIPPGLGLGDPGKRVMSWAGVAMLFLLLSGLYLWWPLKRLSVQWDGPPRRRWFDLHNTVGILSFLFLLLLTVTGILIGYESRTVPWYYKVTGSQPSERPRVRVTPPEGATPIAPDRAVEIARTALPGAVPFRIDMPGTAGGSGVYNVDLRYPEDRTPGGRSFVIVDQYSGKVLFVEGSRTAPGGRRLEILNRAIHTGDVYGIPTKIVASLASLMAAAQLVTGVAMWRKRGRKKRAEPQTAAAH